jgi:hypothetical protein
MTDIVERLSQPIGLHDWPALDSERAEAAHEIRRLKADCQKLRALIQDLTTTRDTAVDMKLERDTEITHLRKQIEILTRIVELEFTKRRPTS